MLEDERGITVRLILSERTTTTMGTVETAEKIVPRHGDVVGEGSKETNPSTFHT